MFEGKAVIGAGYGDEGKGLMSDRLAAATPGAVVVRSNGGAQAGHTVVTEAGVRHVFHHVASGALAGAATHLSRHFVAHPMLFGEEWAALHALGAELCISSDPRALVTTPFDMAINQVLELARGGLRHGSTGVGFGETIERSRHAELAVTTRDLYRPDLRQRLERIRSQWLPTRLAALGVSEVPASIAEALADPSLGERFMDDCERYLARVKLLPDARLRECGPVIFEAAQGLLLDEHYGSFPHVTRSSTGLPNILQIAAEAGITSLDVTYVTRCYTTRHGAGPLPRESAQLQGLQVDDPTNAPNTWQGSLRLAPLDTRVLQRSLAHDLTHAAGSGTRVTAGLAVTCLDQAASAFTVWHGDKETCVRPEKAARAIAERAGLPLTYESWGPRRSDLAYRPSAELPTLRAALR